MKISSRKKETIQEIRQKEFQEEEKTEQPILATLQERVSAFIIDVVLFWFPFATISLIIPVITGANLDLKSFVFQKLGLFFVLVLFIYGGFLTGKYGWTLGKRYMGTRVVIAESFQKVGFGGAFLREAIKLGLHTITFLFSLLNIIIIAKSSKNQAIHDMITKIQVVKVDSGKDKKLLNIIFIILGILFFISLILFIKY